MNNRFNSKNLLLGITASVVIAGFAWVIMRSGPLAPTRVTVARVVEMDLHPTLFGIGTVEARRSYPIGPTMAARVQHVAVDVGDSVQAGQVLAEMDPVDLDQRVAAASAALARAQNAIAAAEAQRRDSRARLELSSSTTRRYTELGNQNFVARSVVDAKRQEEQSASAQFNATEATLAGTRNDHVRLSAEHAALVQQRARIRLLAPVAGVITARDAEPGSTLVAGQSALRMIDPNSLWIRLRLDQSRSNGLRTELPARITLRSQPAISHAGKVARVERVADSVTEERFAQISFDQLPEALSIGEMAEVTLQLPTVSKALVIPGAALRYHGGERGVWKLNEDGMTFIALEIASNSADGSVQIGEGLSVGERIIVHSEKELTAESTIKVVDTLSGTGK